mgnify:CR=1 FL=1
MIHVKFETSAFERKLANLILFIRYTLIRPAVSWFEYQFRCKSSWKLKQVSHSGAPLQKGISYCMIAKDESDAIEYCFQSLVGFADQVICIDNGSEDDTFRKMLDFKKQFGHQMDIIVMSRPEMNLMQCRQECVKYVNCTWFMRGDADFVLTASYKNIREVILNKKRPSAIAYRLLTLFGDENHVSKHHDAISTGEYYLRNFEEGIQYEEFFGRLEHARIPICYRLIRKHSIGILHLNGNKSNERFFYRTCYLDYREHLNSTQGSTVDFRHYEKKWLVHVFDTGDPALIQYRMARLLATMCIRINSDLQSEIQQHTDIKITSPYFIMYRNDQPFLRIKKNHDPEATLKWITANEHESWMPDPRTYYSDSIRKNFKLDD